MTLGEIERSRYVQLTMAFNLVRRMVDSSLGSCTTDGGGLIVAPSALSLRWISRWDCLIS